jgi:hypothetical protein
MQLWNRSPDYVRLVIEGGYGIATGCPSANVWGGEVFWMACRASGVQAILIYRQDHGELGLCMEKCYLIFDVAMFVFDTRRGPRNTLTFH